MVTLPLIAFYTSIRHDPDAAGDAAGQTPAAIGRMSPGNAAARRVEYRHAPMPAQRHAVLNAPRVTHWTCRRTGFTLRHNGRIPCAAGTGRPLARARPPGFGVSPVRPVRNRRRPLVLRGCRRPGIWRRWQRKPPRTPGRRWHEDSIERCVNVSRRAPSGLHRPGMLASSGVRNGARHGQPARQRDRPQRRRDASNARYGRRPGQRSIHDR